MLMLCFKVKNGVERSSYFPKFFFGRIRKIAVIGSNIGLKQTVQKIEEFEKSKFVTSALDYKCFLKQIKGT